MPDRRHYVVVAIIAVAVLVFVARPTDAGVEANVRQYGAVPAVISGAWNQLLDGRLEASLVQQFSGLITALFIHGGFEHLVYNMVFLWAFGLLIARHLGPVTALAMFFITGVCGNVVQVGLNQQSPIPIVGASGAVCGFEGAYLALALRWSLPDPDVWPLAHPIPPLQLGAFGLAGFLFDAYSLMNHNQGVAYGAHLGGFVSGVALAAVLTTIYPSASAWPRRQ